MAVAASALRNRAWRVVLATLVAGLTIPILSSVTAAPSGTAQAQVTTPCVYPFTDCTPSTVPGQTTTTQAGTNPGAQLILIIDLSHGAPGVIVRVRICGAPLNTLIQITFNGGVVADALAATGAGGCTASFALPARTSGGGVLAAAGPVGAALRGRLQAQSSGGGNADASFQVPANVPDGQYLVCAQAAGLGSACRDLTVDSTSVAGTVFGSSGGAPLVSATNGNSFLAFTGLGLMRLVLLAGTLIALGWYLVRRDRRPRRRSVRAA